MLALQHYTRIKTENKSTGYPHNAKNFMDVFSKKKRSEIMSKIRSKNTAVELAYIKPLIRTFLLIRSIVAK